MYKQLLMAYNSHYRRRLVKIKWNRNSNWKSQVTSHKWPWVSEVTKLRNVKSGMWHSRQRSKGQTGHWEKVTTEKNLHLRRITKGQSRDANRTFDTKSFCFHETSWLVFCGISWVVVKNQLQKLEFLRCHMQVCLLNITGNTNIILKTQLYIAWNILISVNITMHQMAKGKGHTNGNDKWLSHWNTHWNRVKNWSSNCNMA